jgi:hypothetical protein
MSTSGTIRSTRLGIHQARFPSRGHDGRDEGHPDDEGIRQHSERE